MNRRMNWDAVRLKQKIDQRPNNTCRTCYGRMIRMQAEQHDESSSFILGMTVYCTLSTVSRVSEIQVTTYSNVRYLNFRL